MVSWYDAKKLNYILSNANGHVSSVKSVLYGKHANLKRHIGPTKTCPTAVGVNRWSIYGPKIFSLKIVRSTNSSVIFDFRVVVKKTLFTKD